MAVKNTLAKRQIPNERVVEFKCGEELVKLSPGIVRNYLVNGNGNVTDQEVAMFINLCRFQHLNPFLREAYLIKFGNQPATIVTGKEAITKRAMRNPTFVGQQAGVVVYHEDRDELEYRVGALVLRNETLVGGWAKVFVKGFTQPIEAVVGFDEYVGTKSDGTINGQWNRKPATMIRKVALTQALREAFPEDLGGMYASEEMGVDFSEETLPPVQPVQIDEQPTLAELPEAAPDEAPPAAQTTMDELDGMF